MPDIVLKNVENTSYFENLLFSMVEEYPVPSFADFFTQYSYEIKEMFTSIANFPDEKWDNFLNLLTGLHELKKSQENKKLPSKEADDGSEK